MLSYVNLTRISRQKYYEKHFGKRTRIFWLPDSFGKISFDISGGEEDVLTGGHFLGYSSQVQQS